MHTHCHSHILILFIASCCFVATSDKCENSLMAGMPPHYVIYHVDDDQIHVDGYLNDTVWHLAPSVNTADFGSIYGKEFERRHPEQKPSHTTTARMLWSKSYLYIGAHLQEPNLWATDYGWDLPTSPLDPLNPRPPCDLPSSHKMYPTCPFRNGDFEFFISPSLHGTTEWYKEFEFNANVDPKWNKNKGPAAMTLSFPRPYHDLHGEILFWLNSDICPDLVDYVYKVTADGKINDPEYARDHPNSSWTIEVKIPIKYLMKNSTAEYPAEGVQWRHAFSRVEYHLRSNSSAVGNYQPYFENEIERKQGHFDRNWVWPPTFMYDIHMPDLWSITQFTEKAPGSGDVPFNVSRVHWPEYGTLSRLYYSQWAFQTDHNLTSTSLSELQQAYTALANPETNTPFKTKKQILNFYPVDNLVWSKECIQINIHPDDKTGWAAEVRVPSAHDVWTIDGWRRIRVIKY